MNKLLKVGLAQTEISSIVAENLDKAATCVRKAAGMDVNLLVFPEMFMANPAAGTALAEIAEPLDGPFVSSLANLARVNNMTIVCGLWEAVPGESTKAANVVIALDNRGELVARYNKVHLFDALNVKESERMTGGKTPPPLFAVGGFNLGLAICYDLRFPELFRYLSQRGADAVLVPAAWYSGPMKEEQWLTLLRARAIENTIYTVGSNLCGPSFAARSVAYDPFGVQLADAGEGEDVVSAVLSIDRIAAVRKKLPCLKHARAELFMGSK